MRIFENMKDPRRVCARCGKTKLRGAFGKRPNGTPRSYCRQCDRAYAAEQRRRKKKEES